MRRTPGALHWRGAPSHDAAELPIERVLFAVSAGVGITVGVSVSIPGSSGVNALPPVKVVEEGFVNIPPVTRPAALRPAEFR